MKFKSDRPSIQMDWRSEEYEPVIGWNEYDFWASSNDYKKNSSQDNENLATCHHQSNKQ